MEDKKLGLTINQAALMFFPEKFAYDYARSRLRKLWERGIFKKYTNDYTEEIIYYLDNKPSYHDNAVLNVYANLVRCGYRINYFKHEQQWLGGKYRSDAFIIAENDTEYKYIMVEVDKSTPTNIKKYDELYNTGELQKAYKTFPLLLILSDVERKYDATEYPVVCTDIHCTNFMQKVLAG
jgi:hypothetical protein